MCGGGNTSGGGSNNSSSSNSSPPPGHPEHNQNSGSTNTNTNTNSESNNGGSNDNESSNNQSGPPPGHPEHKNGTPGQALSGAPPIEENANVVETPETSKTPGTDGTPGTSEKPDNLGVVLDATNAVIGTIKSSTGVAISNMQITGPATKAVLAKFNVAASIVFEGIEILQADTAEERAVQVAGAAVSVAGMALVGKVALVTLGAAAGLGAAPVLAAVVVGGAIILGGGFAVYKAEEYAEDIAQKTINYFKGFFSPIAIDLNGDGAIETIAASDSNVFFDTDGDGLVNEIGWISGDDGFLVYDKDEDGAIEDFDELSFTSYVDGATTDLEGLRHFDTNQNGQFDSGDEEWSKFKIWQDSNQNGVVDDGELFTLEELGLAALNLTSDGEVVEQNGNTIHGTTSFVHTDGTTIAAFDLSFAVAGVAVQTYHFDNAILIASATSDGDVLQYVTYTNDASHSYVVDEDSHVQVVFGGDGVDVFTQLGEKSIAFHGYGGNDILIGGDLSDVLVGGEGADTLSGGAGNDVLDGGAGSDALTGGEGADVFLLRDSESDLADADIITDFEAEDKIDFGDEITTIWLNAARDANNLIYGGEIYADAAQTKVLGYLQGYKVALGYNNLVNRDINIILLNENADDEIVTFEGEDTLYSGHGNDSIHSGAGNDTIYGGFGNDIIYGEAGNDKLLGESGDDEIYGGSDNDFIEGWSGRDILDGGDGIDTLSYYGSRQAVSVNIALNIADGGHAVGDVISNFENLLGSKHGDTLIGINDGGTIYGMAGDDTIQGGDGDDKLHGNEGDDTLTGGLGIDYLEGYAGADVIDGGGDRDTLSYRSSDSGVEVNLLTNLFKGGHAEGDSISNIENVVGSTFADILSGNAENNIIVGGEGNDVLRGGTGLNWLFGEGGADQFVLSALDKGTTAAYTIIKDFTQGEDVFAFDGTIGTADIALSSFKEHTVFWIKNTQDVLALIENIDPLSFTLDDFTTLEVA